MPMGARDSGRVGQELSGLPSGPERLIELRNQLVREAHRRHHPHRIDQVLRGPREPGDSLACPADRSAIVSWSITRSCCDLARRCQCAGGGSQRQSCQRQPHPWHCGTTTRRDSPASAGAVLASLHRSTAQRQPRRGELPASGQRRRPSRPGPVGGRRADLPTRDQLQAPRARRR